MTEILKFGYNDDFIILTVANIHGETKKAYEKAKLKLQKETYSFPKRHTLEEIGEMRDKFRIVEIVKQPYKIKCRFGCNGIIGEHPDGTPKFRDERIVEVQISYDKEQEVEYELFKFLKEVQEYGIAEL